MYSDILRIYPDIQKRLQAENMFATSQIYAIIFATYYRLVCSMLLFVKQMKHLKNNRLTYNTD